jgi:hypothetical protein
VLFDRSAIAMGEVSNEFLSRYERDPDASHDIAIKAQPALAMYEFVKRGGESVTVRFVLRGPRGFARNLSQAQQISGNKKNSEYYRYIVPYGMMEGSILFPLRDIEMCEADPEFGADFLESNYESGIAGFAQEIVYQMFGLEGGSSGSATFHAATSGSYPVFSLRLTDPADAGRLMVGDWVEVSTASGTGVSDTTLSAKGIIVDRDIDTGYFQIAAESAPSTPASPAGWDDTGATTYNVFRLGEMHQGVPEDIVIPHATYVPDTRQTNETLGLNRGADSALSGMRLTTAEAGTLTLARRVKKTVAKQRNRLGADAHQLGRTQKLFMNPEEWDVFEDQENSRVMRTVEPKAINGYEAIVVKTSQGDLEVVSEPAQRKGRMRLISPKMCKMVGPSGKMVKLVNPGSGVLRLKEGSSDHEARPFFIGAHIVGPPMAHATIPTT